MLSQLTTFSRLSLVLLVCTLLPAAVLAEPKGDGKAALRRLEQRARGAEQAKAAAEAKIGELGAQADLAKSKAASLEKRRSSLEKELRALKEEKAALEEKLSATESTLSKRNLELATVDASLSERNVQLISTQKELANTRQERQTYLADLGQRTQELGNCNVKNGSLLKTAEDLLKRYRSKTCTDALLEKEPITGLKRVKVENEIEEYLEKLERDTTPDVQAVKRKEAELAEAARRQEIEEERQHLDKRERMTAERRKQEKFKEQKKLDDLTRGIKSFFEGIEW